MPGYKWYGVARVTGPSAEYAAIFYRYPKYKLLDCCTLWFKLGTKKYQENPGIFV